MQLYEDLRLYLKDTEVDICDEYTAIHHVTKDVLMQSLNKAQER
jgi:hypothetical protein